MKLSSYLGGNPPLKKLVIKDIEDVSTPDVPIYRLVLDKSIPQVTGSVLDNGNPMIMKDVRELFIVGNLLEKVDHIKIVKHIIYAKTNLKFDISRPRLLKTAKVWLVDISFDERVRLFIKSSKQS